MAIEPRNMELMQTLDVAQNVEVFRARHKPDVVVRWPGQPDLTIGIEYDLVGFHEANRSE